MAKKRRSGRSNRGGRSASGRAGNKLSVRRTQSGDAWMLVHPRCVRERADDLDEVRQMIEAGETDIAIDDLRWLLSDCSEFIEAHRMLGELALADQNDLPLARGHFGFAFQLGLAALRKGGTPSPLPYRMPANQAFFEAGKGLAWCLHELGKREMALEPLQTLLACDPSDPLGLAEMLQRWEAEA